MQRILLIDREDADETANVDFCKMLAGVAAMCLVVAIGIVVAVFLMVRPAKSEPCENCERLTVSQATISHRAKRGRNIRYDRNDSSGNEIRVVGHPAGCPGRAFCGCGVSVRIWGHPVREYFLAANYKKFPRATCAPGMVAARYGHAMYIEGECSGGSALVYDPNSGGHRTRVHHRSLAGYSIHNPRASRYASAQ